MTARSVRSAGAFLVRILPILLLNGCLFFPQYPETYGYVLKMRDPRRITEWTLSQTDEQKVSDGMAALSAVHVRQPGNAEAQAQAEEGFLRVHGKLRSGWPGFKADPELQDSDAFGDLPSDMDARHLELTVRRGYYVALQFGGTVWEQLKPPANERARLASWTAEGRRVGWLK